MTTRSSASSSRSTCGLAGFAADLAADGRAGLDRARRGQPDVAILDAGMPGLDGWAVAARLRSDPATSSIKIVMLAPGPGGTPRSGARGARERGGPGACSQASHAPR